MNYHQAKEIMERLAPPKVRVKYTLPPYPSQEDRYIEGAFISYWVPSDRTIYFNPYYLKEQVAPFILAHEIAHSLHSRDSLLGLHGTMMERVKMERDTDTAAKKLLQSIGIVPPTQQEIAKWLTLWAKRLCTRVRYREWCKVWSPRFTGRF